MPSKDKQRRMIYLSTKADNKVEKLTEALGMSNSAFFEMLAHSFYDFYGIKEEPKKIETYEPDKKLTKEEENANIKNYPGFMQYWMKKGVI